MKYKVFVHHFDSRVEVRESNSRNARKHLVTNNCHHVYVMTARDLDLVSYAGMESGIVVSGAVPRGGIEI